ncbi:MAG: bifunctional folylpolyglutamate synthase/dihydrofolate synthase, partial [Clostridia bacterium]|nr:bifunctional folylpolyglutamate synthase/dihydrofolate synthase [Clostridia bacterium]
MTYPEAIQYLQGTNRAFCKPGTERVAELCALLGNPQKDLSVVHVAGTNGKGSFCVILASLLQSAGFKVGRFSSPALRRINECVTVNGREISDEDVSRLVALLQPLADGQTDRPTEFEILTALAFRYFWEQRCDFVILECGMGGWTDATNVIHRPLLSVMTEISVDHASFLGSTVPEIATHKAGIIKENCPALWCGKNPEAEGVIRKVCTEKNAELFTVPKDTLQ